MIKQYIYKSLLIAAALVLFTSQLWAQKSDKKSVQDSIKTSKLTSKVTQRLFDSNKNNSTAAISTVTGETLYKTPTPNILNTLYGRLSGLTVNQNSGDPGNDNPDMAIRGVGSSSMGNQYNNYRIFVDGFEVYSNYLAYMSASDIESISVLKDAASLAQFGMIGANGILWVTTKKGEGKPKITFQTRTGVQSAININKPLSSYDYATLYNQALSNDNGAVWNQTLIDSKGYSAAKLDAYKNGTGTNVDWYDEVLRKNGSYTDGNLSFSGDLKNLKYFVSVNYGNQQGLLNVKNTDSTANSQMNYYGIRSNLQFDVSKSIEGRVSLYARLEDRKQPNLSSGNSSAIFTDLENYPSNIYPVYDGITLLDGTYQENRAHFSGTSIYPRNPYASVVGTGWKSGRRRFLQGNFGLKEKLDFITKGLYLDESVSFVSYASTAYNKTRNYARYINGLTTTTDQLSSLAASSMSANGQDDWKQAKIMLGYDRQFGDHRIQSAVKYHISEELGEGIFSYQVHCQNISGKANYNFKNKYVGEFGFSYYGSDAYAPGNQWGFYPTVSGAWIVSNENFLADNSVVDFLKLRASVGTSGNNNTTAGNGISNYNSAGRYLFQQYYAGSGSFYTGTTTPSGTSGLVKLFNANPDIFAEKSLKYNVGMDFTIFNKLSVGIDAYVDKRSDIPVSDNTTPSYFGNNISIKNLGRMTNKGIDADLTFSDKVGEFGYSITGMVSFNRNKLDFIAETPTSYAYNAYTGRPYGTQIGLVADGFYQMEDFNTDGTLKSELPLPLFGKVQPGDIKYKNLNPADDNVIDQSDVTEIGKASLPELIYSMGINLNYKAFDFSAFLQGATGSTVNILGSANAQVEAFTNNGNAYAIAKGAWAYYPDQNIDTRATATYPRLTTVTNSNNYRTSSFWMKDNSYIRVRNFEIGYTLDSKLISKVGMSKFRISLSAANPLTWSSLLKNYKMDPETFSGYPSLKTYSVGITANF